MGKTLYLECYSGISGDMTVGALLDLGASREVLEQALKSLGVHGYHLHFGRTKKCGIDAYDFDVHLDHEEHVHEHGHSHSHGGHAHVHRNIHDIQAIINRLDSSDRVRRMAGKIFNVVAEAESAAHGIPIDEVHFHEVGAIDSIVDIIGTAVCLDNLGIEHVIVSALSEGRGYVRCQHGTMPVPVPATANIAASYGLELRLTDNEGEMVTPTGAAIAAALRTDLLLPEKYVIRKIGIGAGRKEFKNANILRAMLIEPVGQPSSDLWVLETNVDDCSGEAFGYTLECLFKAGAADVWYTPVYMKKNRPAYLLSVLCEKSLIEFMEDIIFAQTTSIGIRRYPVLRTALKRKKIRVSTKYGEAEVKVCYHKENTYYYPEFDSVRRICEETGKDFQQICHEILKQARNTEE